MYTVVMHDAPTALTPTGSVGADAVRVEHRFRAMGTGAHIVVVGGPPGLARVAEHRVRDLEGRWSRFLASSELCRLNDAAGRPTLVSPDTFALVSLAVEAWQRTGGRFDPTVYDALVAHGYDRSFEQVAASSPVARIAAGTGGIGGTRRDEPAPGCAGIDLDPVLPLITLPPGVHLDLGGIGKGHAADLVTAELIDRGADGVLVNLGGDLRGRGTGPATTASPAPRCWTVSIEHPAVPGRELARVAMAEGAVATSTTARRTWTVGGRTMHHLIDPTTGSPCGSDLVQVTVIGGSAAWAEVMAKVALFSGRARAAEVVADAGMTGFAVAVDGRVEPFPGLDPYVCVPPPDALEDPASA